MPIDLLPNGLRYPRWGGGRRSRPTGKMIRRRKMLEIAADSAASGARFVGQFFDFTLLPPELGDLIGCLDFACINIKRNCNTRPAVCYQFITFPFYVGVNITCVGR